MNEHRIAGWWKKGDSLPEPVRLSIGRFIHQVTRPVFIADVQKSIVASDQGTALIGDLNECGIDWFPLKGFAPPMHPQDLGNPEFKNNYKIRYPYVAGAMANGITSERMVEEAGRSGMIGFFGAAGLEISEIESALMRLQNKTPSFPFGFNLINSPNEPALEAATVDLYLKHQLRLISASAYMEMTPPLVYFRVKGIHRDSSGKIVCPNKVIAKVSRVEVARKFFSPPPEKILILLVEKHLISREEAILAEKIPVAEDLTAEADSGGHTDNRPAVTLLPIMMAVRDEMAEKYGYDRIPCVGLGGGIATPESAAAAFAMGAAYVLTGSVNQSCIESGTSETVRRMLSEAGQADIAMAPAADMFEMGVKVQVLKRGTMFPLKAARLYDLYQRYNSVDEIPDKEKALLEKDFFKCSLMEEWGKTKAFFAKKDPEQIVRAEKEPRHKMALIFRSYLGQSSKWSVKGDPSRRMDYQIWCGPAIGAFNEWVKGSFLAKTENRKTVTVAMNLLLGASVTLRANWLKSQGNVLPAQQTRFYPMEPEKISEILAG